METFMVNKNSWHYKLVEESVTDKYPYELRQKAMPKDFCSYWRRVMVESLKIGIIFSATIAALVVFVGLLGYMIYAIFFDFGGAGFPFLIFFAIVMIVVSITSAPHILRKRRINKLKKEDDSSQSTNIFVQRYKAWKGKFCPAIQYEKET